ncbi:hypothetical protein ZYGM_000176 [Zygosaccharomyces mellis]|uniref:SH3 domain-containing protein n=1 Tax=Zygosaccharomyces mellis TaxID=42258 RepID=A0A4C2E1X3_9SACH|nr:hypothetical protein ZYGM_000176 [Zygosaccharomyces mellis]
MNQGPSVNAFQGAVSPSLLPAEFGGKLSLEEPDTELLNDPTLTENYSELLKVKPHKPMEPEDESNSGSVVVTGGLPTKKMNDSHRFNESHHRNEHDNGNDDNSNSNSNSNSNNFENNSNAGSEDPNNGDQEYDYSDSDFEENLEKRLQDMDTEIPGERRTANNEGSSGLGSMYDGLLMALSEDEDDLYLENDEDEENMGSEDELFEEDELQPLPPPQELDPDKLYALYAFNGPDPSHCQLKQDEACALLNDQDAYWWLVRRYSDSKIGFAPAEILETYPERLARLNCWKNENMSPRKNSTTGIPDEKTIREESERANEHLAADENGGDGDDDDDDDKTARENSMHFDVDNDENCGEGESHQKTALREYGKSNKSVSFNDVVSYADRYIQDSDDESYYGTDEPTQYDEFSESKLRIGRVGEGNDFDLDDDMSEANSDASFNTASMVPLNIEKRRQPSPPQPPSSPPPHTEVQMRKTGSDEDIVKEINENRNSFIETHDTKEESEEEFQDGLHKIFEAPVLPFGRKNSHLETSNLDSISIGEFSPSSSEWTNDSPQHQQFVDHHSPRTIPPSRAIQDLTKIVDTEDDSSTAVKKNSIPETKSNEEDPKQQLQKNPHRQQRPVNKELPASSSSSEEEIFMDAERVGSSTSVNSASSVSRQFFHSSSVVTAVAGKHHPIIGQLYDPIFHRMDDLLKQIDEASK